jgi:hypothetical protein
VKEQKPAFVTNSILPNTNYGTILANGKAVTTAKWVKSLYDGDVDHVKDIPPRKSLLSFIRIQELIPIHRMVRRRPGLCQAPRCLLDQPGRAEREDFCLCRTFQLRVSPLYFNSLSAFSDISTY